ncbi:helix-turn-helix transcriptional regulator [Kitasatospora acidiphila]|uniref:Helix-turn-helix transcriptional regulator n=1 Tax=Kitasatospora acidiphila TaxID=2567942 RepID=A0A540W6Y1_9ACTN|nr:helix-turn-helix transcriptional regulator [Kitasatospora acidiphila]
MPTPTPPTPGRLLTAREIEVVAAVAAGGTNEQIGDRLGVSWQAVKSHLRRIGRKLGTGDRAGIVGAAIRTGQLTIEPRAEKSRVPVICQCARCQDQLEAGEGMAHRLTRLRLPERAA